ncbi:unnamed protein product [Heterobilharzia americana]|nr:unnamed protein product [Heterobilharzia americana]
MSIKGRAYSGEIFLEAFVFLTILFGKLKYIGRMFNKPSENSESSYTTDSSSSTEHFKTNMDWDFYAIPFLAGLLLLFIVYIRHRRN